MCENGLANWPAQIVNCDETGLPLTHKPPKVIARVWQKHPYAVASNEKEQITVFACGSAVGYYIPQMVAFDYKSLKPEISSGEVPGTFYGLSESGWMDTELFDTSHYHLEVLRIAAAEGVITYYSH